jgi:hypothetical protein
MIKNNLRIYLLIFPFVVIGCAGNKHVDAEQTCKEQISRAERQLQAQTGKLDKALSDMINNLIIAAKIHAQHAEQVMCVEKTARALTLLQDTTTVKDPQN